MVLVSWGYCTVTSSLENHLFGADFSSAEELKDIVVNTSWGRIPRLYYCFLTALPFFLHPLPFLISKCLNLTFGIQGTRKGFCAQAPHLVLFGFNTSHNGLPPPQQPHFNLGIRGGTTVKNLPDNTGDSREAGLIPGPERSLGEGNGHRYSCLENPCREEPGGLYIVQQVRQKWAQSSLQRLSPVRSIGVIWI